MPRRRWGSSWAALGMALALVMAAALTSCATQGGESNPPAPLPSMGQVTASGSSATPVPTVTATSTPTPSLTPTATPSPTPAPISLDTSALPAELAQPILDALPALAPLDIEGVSRPLTLAAAGQQADAALSVESLAAAYSDPDGAMVLAERYYAAVAPFQTIADEISLERLRALWQGAEPGVLLVAGERVAAELAWLWGPGQATVIPRPEMGSSLEQSSGAIGLVAFDTLDPTLKVLTIDGVSVLSNQLEPATYPLGLAVTLRGPLADALAPALAPLYASMPNRDPQRLTQLVMTGVTAMCRLTAERMERLGTLYPALVISDTLRAADLTHISNEVPFIQGCEPDIRSGNLTFCSDYDYWEALEAVGVDLVGLSGNHVNDFGYDGARESLAFYRARGVPVYGSGLNVTEACAPIRMQDHGNTFAFLATLAWNPASAWATETLPGTCYYYQERERLIETIRSLKAEGVEVVAVELQYLETYNPFPTDQQVREFRELYDAGADIVTGVQSHVPQAWEPYAAAGNRAPGIIVYGLGNLFFDQMWSWETRTGLIARHTIYDGRLISSEVLTTVLENAAQPRWTTSEERAELLQRIFEAAPPGR